MQEGKATNSPVSGGERPQEGSVVGVPKPSAADPTPLTGTIQTAARDADPSPSATSLSPAWANAMRAGHVSSAAEIGPGTTPYLGRLVTFVQKNIDRDWNEVFSREALKRNWPQIKDKLAVAGRYASIAFAGWLALVLIAIVLLRFVNPPGSALMLIRLAQGTSLKHQWVPLKRISPNLMRAVVVSEDWRFCQHSGIDIEEIRAAIRRSRHGIPRGASTISMQVAKNMFLWPSRSYIRKILEVPLTLAIEVFWPKRRILEVYLNIAEWGRGVFGAGAAARYHFGKTPSGLTPRQAALLAVALPNPFRRRAGKPGPGTRALARTIQRRMVQGGRRATACITKK